MIFHVLEQEANRASMMHKIPMRASKKLVGPRHTRNIRRDVFRCSTPEIWPYKALKSTEFLYVTVEKLIRPATPRETYEERCRRSPL